MAGHKVSSGIICYIGIGSNLGNALQNCKDAIKAISLVDEIQLTATSSFYSTEPVGIENQNWFVNAVIEIRTSFPALGLLRVLQNIENNMGRMREIKGGPRIIDIDLLFYNQDVINEKDLIVPHPEIHKRQFVLEPLNEIASFFIHPTFGVSVRGLKDRLDDKKIVKILEKK
ncbi:MAG: 2-amino-4-hydroxy-6-hydroxymethyldihydropteridine diphosphokinase [Smithella sp.]